MRRILPELFYLSVSTLMLACFRLLPVGRQLLFSKNTIQENISAKSDEASAGSAVLCCIVLDEEAYIDEFVDYYLGMGFNKIYIYDNTEFFQMKSWGRRKVVDGERIELIHYPGTGRQQEAYLECAKKAKESNHTWAAFFDVDEFLVLQKHKNVNEFLTEHLCHGEGSIGVNWLIFPAGEKILYEPLPVTKRFIYREPIVNHHIKSIVRLEDMDVRRAPHVHYPHLWRGTNHDTNGKSINGPFNELGPADVAVLHHYHTKSFKEYVAKKTRGRADVNDWNKNQSGEECMQAIVQAKDNFKNALVDESFMNVTSQGYTYDDSAWAMLKHMVPKYAHYDLF